MWWADRRGRETEQFEYFEEREMDLETQGWRGIACGKPALLPEPVVKSQAGLPLRVMCGSLAMLQQGAVLMSMIYITTRDHGDAPGLGSCLGSRRYPTAVLDLTLTLRGCGTLESWARVLLVAVLRRVGSVPCLGSTAERVLMVGVEVGMEVSSLQGVGMGELTLPPLCREVAWVRG